MAHPSGDGRRPPQGPGVLRCAVIKALVVVVAVGLAVLFIWFIIRPAPLEYVVNDAQVSGFNLTTNGRLNATFDLSTWADNRNNKVAMYYDTMEVRVLVDEQAVAIAEVAPFLQPHHNATEIRIAPVARSAPLGGAAAAKLRKERSKGKMVVGVVVRAWIRFKIASLKTKHYTLRAYCSPVDAYFPLSPKRQTDCDVDV